MAANAQEAFIQRVRRALQRPAGDLPPAAVLESRPSAATDRALATLRNRNRDQRLTLLDQLIAAGKPIHLTVVGVPNAATAAEAITRLVREKGPEWGGGKQVAAWRHPLIDRLDMPQRLASEDIPVIVEHAEPPETPAQAALNFHDPVAQAFVGITSADFCVAESGTLVLKTRPGQSRRVSLLPLIHVAVITLDQVLASFTELYACLCHDPVHRAEGITTCMTFISGPSRTADIEAVMVHGAHGPKEVWLYVIT